MATACVRGHLPGTRRCRCDSGAYPAGGAVANPTAAEVAGGRPLPTIVRQPRFVAAAITGAVTYMLMNFLMTAAPLAMHMCGHSQESANPGNSMACHRHVWAELLTGGLIERFGAGRVATVGLLLTGVSAAVGLAGMDSHHWATLILLGLGWNFGFSRGICNGPGGAARPRKGRASSPSTISSSSA